MAIRLIGVPFDGMGRKPGQAGAPAALRAAGLESAISSREVVSQPDLDLPEARAERSPESGLLNETALVKMIAAVYAEEVAADPASVTRSAIESISSHTTNWWLHTDLDVLSEREFFARGAPGEISLSGGLTWQQLTEVIRTALSMGGCRGWSVAIYNPDLDPDGSQARRIVQLVSDIAPHLPR